MSRLVSFGKYLLAGIEFLRRLPVASILDPTNPGSSFAIHPGAGLARVNGRFFEFPFSSKTSRQFPSNVLEIATPSHRALPTPINTATIDSATLSSQTSTGALVALNLLVVLWCSSLLALSLTYKPVLLAVRIWLATLRCRVAQTARAVTQGIKRVAFFVIFYLKICPGALENVRSVASALICSKQDILHIAQKLIYPCLRSAVAFIFKNQRALLSPSSLASITNIIQQIFLFCVIKIPYIDLILVIAISPAAGAAGILLAVLLGVIKPNCPNPPFIKIVCPADMVAGMRVKPPNRFFSDLVPKDHTGGTLVDIRGAYHQTWRARHQARSAKSCLGQSKKFTVMWITITLLGLGINYMPFVPSWIVLHSVKIASRAANILNIFKPEAFYPAATDATVTSSPLSLIWIPVPRVCPLSAGNSESPLQSISDLDGIFQMDFEITSLPRLSCQVEHSTSSGSA